MTEIPSYELVQLLSTHCVANVQNGLIHTLAIWLDEHIKGESVRRRKEEAFSTFYKFVRDVVQERKYERKVWTKNQLLPYPYNEMKVINSLSDKILNTIRGVTFEKGLEFLAELWGGWILVCPNSIIQNSPEFAGSTTSTTTETELTNLMLQYLDVVYGNM